MQKFIENKSEFSSPCVDNSAKNQQKSVENHLANGVSPKNSAKTTNFTENIDTSPAKNVISEEKNKNFNTNNAFNTKNLGNSGGNGGVGGKNEGINLKNTIISGKDTESGLNNGLNDSVGNNNDNLNVENIETIDNSSSNAHSVSKSDANDGETSVICSFEEAIERDYEDFKLIYPNVSKKTLLGDESFRIFTEGKESKSTAVNYAKYQKLVKSIGEDAILQEKHRQNNANSILGALSSTQNANQVYFTREQVKNMSPSEIKRNYELIRKSQQNW